MNDMTTVIQPKSDQLNADSLQAGPMNIEITKVAINPGGEQPITVSYRGDGGKPWKPCKSMARVLVAAWGPDASKYVGRSVTLFEDPTVTWGGMAVGGIRVSHMSDLDGPLTLALTATRGNKKPYKVQPLKSAPKQPEPEPFDVDEFMSSVLGYIETATDPDELAAWWSEQRPEWIKAGKADREKAIQTQDAVKAKIAELTPE